MKQIAPHIPHLVIALAVIGVAGALAGLHVVDGATAVALIGAAGGVSLGGAVASSSPTAAATTGPAVVTSASPSATPPPTTPSHVTVVPESPATS